MKIKSEYWLGIYAVILAGLVYFFGIFTDLTGDAGLYAAISRQMVESGDWLNLKINGNPYDQKPHLLFWLAGSGIAMAGNTNFAFKILPFLYSLGGIYFAYRLGKTLRSHNAGLWAALFTATSQMVVLYSLDIHTDTIMQTGVMLALWQLTCFLQNKKPSAFIFGFTGVGLAMLSKGPVGAVIPFFAVLFFLIIKKAYRDIFHPRWIIGILIVFVCISPSLYHLFKNFGIEGLKFFFVTNNFGRISGEYAGTSTDPLFYLHTLLWATVPWTLLVITGLGSEIKYIFYKKEISNSGYLLVTVMVFFLILSLSKAKAPNYFLIALSPISVITGIWMEKRGREIFQKSAWVYHGQRLFILLFVAIFIGILIVLNNGKDWWFLLPLLPALIMLFRFRTARSLPLLILNTLIVWASVNLFLNAEAIPELSRKQGARQALNIYESERDADDVLMNLNSHEFALFFYAREPVRDFSGWDDFYKFIETDGSWIYTTESGLALVRELTSSIGQVYEIRKKGLNELTLPYLNPRTRQNALDKNYLIRIKIPTI